MKTDPTVAVVFAIFLLMVGFLAGAFVFRGKSIPQNMETAAQEIRHADGALTLQRDPSAEAPEPLPMPDKESVRVRTLLIDVPQSEIPQRIQVDITMAPNGTQRATVKSSTGAILAGVDIPENRDFPAEKKWTVGVMAGKTGGIFAQYNRNRWTVGMAYMADKSAFLTAGVRF